MLLRDFSNYSEAKFLNELSQLDLTGAVSGLNDVNKSFSVFYNKLNKLLNKHAPFKPISKRKKKRLLKPWVTKGIRKSINIRDRSLFIAWGGGGGGGGGGGRRILG